ncbi:hypothetical protein ACQ7B2_28215, partial [Escherichia coli]
HLSVSNLAPEIRIVGTSLDDLDDDAFRALADGACHEFCSRKVSEEEWGSFAKNLTYVPQRAGPEALAASVREQMAALGGETGLLHYL